MSSFSELIITVDGLNQVNESLVSDKEITFTKMVVSSQPYELSEVERLKEIEDVKQCVGIRKIDISESGIITVDSVFNNESGELTEGFFIRTVGLYSKLDNGNEILFAVAVEKTDNPSYMPAHGLTTTAIQIKFRIKLSNAENINITVDSAGMATIGDVLDVSGELHDSVSLINGTIEELKDSAADMNKTINELEDTKLDKTEAAAMNAEINALKNGKLDKDGNAKTATKANLLLAMRSDADLNADLNEEEAIWIREQKPESPNSPSEHLYHVINIKGKGSCRTQLALGVTTDKVLYQNRNSLNNWEEWKELLFTKNGDVTVNGDIKADGTKRVRAGNKVRMWSDNEGGNIDIESNTGKTSAQIDNLNDVLRIYIHDNVNNTNYFPITIGGTLVSVLTELKAAKGLNLLGMLKFYKDTNDSAYVEFGGVNSANNAQPHFRFRQWSNTLNVGPSTNGECSLGWDSNNQFANVAARNIYNSSGLITSSDRNKKKDFADITQGFADSIIDGLIPTSFKYKDGTSGRTHYALVAQHVEELLKQLGIDSKDFAPLVKAYPQKEVENEDGSVSLETDYSGEPEYHLRYEGFTGLIIKYIQGLKKKDLTLENEMAQLEDKLELLGNKMTQLEDRLELMESKLNSI